MNGPTVFSDLSPEDAEIVNPYVWLWNHHEVEILRIDHDTERVQILDRGYVCWIDANRVTRGHRRVRNV